MLGAVLHACRISSFSKLSTISVRECSPSGSGILAESSGFTASLGDPSIYSTYIYIHKRVLAAGFEAQLVPGIPSFCAAAARLNEGLTETSQALHVIPASYKGLAEAMELPGTKVLMKSGKSIGKIRDLIQQQPERWEAKMVERCGMEGERVFLSAEEIDPQASYFSIVVVKDR